MKFQKGHKKVGGIKKGDQHKVTKDIKEAYKMLLEMNLVNLTDWMQSVANKDPERAIKIMIELSEYVIPKLQRTEVKNENEPANDPYENLTFEQLYQLAHGRKPDTAESKTDTGKE